MPGNDYGQLQQTYLNKDRALSCYLLGIKVWVTPLGKWPRSANMLDKGEGNLGWTIDKGVEYQFCPLDKLQQ